MNANTARNTAAPASPEDWHPADVVAGLRKAGWSLRKLSVHNGYYPNGLAKALSRPWPKGERLIAEALGISAADIWPQRHAKRLERIARRDQRAAEGRAAGSRRRSARPSTTA